MLALLPGVHEFFVLAYVLGALAAVAFAIRWLRQPLDQNEGTRLGFLSSFYGLLLANGVSDILWKVFHYRDRRRFHRGTGAAPLSLG